MKTLPFNNWSTWLEDGDRQREAGRYNPATEISYKIPGSHCHKTATLGAGRSDSLGVFYEGKRLYVLSTNQGLEYVGLQVFEESDDCSNGTADEVAETFLDSAAPNIEYILGLTPIWRAKQLANWIDA